MEITFLPLTYSHFPLLLEWLSTDHVRKWWDQDIDWTAELIEAKYTSYTEGLKGQKPIYAYIIYLSSSSSRSKSLLYYKYISRPTPEIIGNGNILDGKGEDIAEDLPIGYIQYYNIDDFSHDTSLPENIPELSAALDFYIGDPEHLGRGYGAKVVKEFCEEIIWQHFDACFVDPNVNNIAAIKTYKAAGFRELHQTKDTVWMVKYRL